MSQLIVCGSIALDRIMNFSGKYADLIHPEKMHVLSLSVLLEKVEDTPGGVGANIAHNIAFLGEKPILLGSVGPDARMYLDKLAFVGVDTGYIHRSQSQTATFNVITDAEDNQIGGFYPGAMADSASLTLKPWADQDIFVCISAHDPVTMAAQVAECKQFGLRLMYDPGQQVSNVPAEDLRAGIEAAEVLVVNDYELAVLCKKIGIDETELITKVKVVITTFGKEGSVIEGHGVKSSVKVAAAKPAEIADPTGAGDAYRAGFLYGYLRQWELAKCGQLGTVLASFAIEQHGTQVAFSKAAILQRYKETYNQEIAL